MTDPEASATGKRPVNDSGAERYNPHLKAALLEVVKNQLRANDPPEVRETFNRLVAQGLAIRRDGRVVGSLEKGQVLCFGQSS